MGAAEQITAATAGQASRAKPMRPAKADAFKQAMARAMEGAGPDAPPPRPARAGGAPGATQSRTLPGTAASAPAPMRAHPRVQAHAQARAPGLAAQAASTAQVLQGRSPAAQALQPMPPAAAGEAGFRARIAQAEAGAREGAPGYGARNPASGALGRYQFLPIALQDLGWQDAGGRWTALAAGQGVRTDAEFLANPAAQEAAMSAYLVRTEQQLDRNGSLARAGGSVTGLDGSAVALTESGLVAAAHRRGAGSVARYLAHRLETPEAALTQAQRQAFLSVERRLRDFAEVGYSLASRGGTTGPRRA